MVAGAGATSGRCCSVARQVRQRANSRFGHDECNSLSNAIALHELGVCWPVALAACQFLWSQRRNRHLDPCARPTQHPTRFTAGLSSPTRRASAPRTGVTPCGAGLTAWLLRPAVPFRAVTQGGAALLGAAHKRVREGFSQLAPDAPRPALVWAVRTTVVGLGGHRVRIRQSHQPVPRLRSAEP